MTARQPRRLGRVVHRFGRADHHRSGSRHQHEGQGRAVPAATTPQLRLALTMTVMVIILTLVGSVMILSASSVQAAEATGSSFTVFIRQCMWFVLALIGMGIASRIDYRTWADRVALLLAGTIGMLVLVLLPGVGRDVNGAQRWIGTGAFTIQPAEPAKFALIVFCAAVIARNHDRIDDLPYVLRPVLVVLGVYGALLMLQPNLGTSSVLVFIVMGMLLWAGLPLRVLGMLGSAGVALGLGFALSADYRRDRVTAFLDPWADASDTGYQTIQSLISVASGGVSGSGLGAARSKWGFLPEAHTDFVFAIIGEELGLVGSLIVVALFVAMVACGFRIARRASDTFGMMLAVGVSTWFAVQAFVNVGAVLSLMPITGVPLPFVSFGGSSLITTMGAAGVLVNVALRGSDPDPSERRRLVHRPSAARGSSSPSSSSKRSAPAPVRSR